MIKRNNVTKELLQSEFNSKNLEILSYTNTIKPIYYRCKKCGKEHSILYTNFRKGQGCPYCGGKVVTYQEVKEAFKKEGYDLLSQEYINAKQKLEFSCNKCGNKHFITWDSFKQGSRCAYCAGRLVDIDFIRREFEKESLILLEDVYVNNRQKLKFFCKKGNHEHSISWGDFKSGGRCGVCDHKHLTLEYIKSKFEENGYTLLSTEYINSRTKLDFICPNKHTYYISWNDFSGGYRCGICAGKHKTKNEKSKVFEEAGYTVVGEPNSWDYRFTELMCPKGHRCFIPRDAFLRRGVRCGVCAGKHRTEEENRKVFEDLGYKVIGDIPKSNRVLVNLVCPNGHECKISRDNFSKKVEPRRCPHCNEHGKSRPEKDIAKIIQETYPNTKLYLNIRDKIPPKELDIYLPEFNLAIEYCGVYWHSNNVNIRSEKSHFDKVGLCAEKCIKLLTFFEDEWLYKRSQLLDTIYRNINILQIIPQADIKFQKISFRYAKRFNKENSIQLFHTHKINFGYFYKNDLKVCVSGYLENNILVIRNITYKIGWFFNIDYTIFLYLKKWCTENGILCIDYVDDLRFKMSNLDGVGFLFVESIVPFEYVVKGRKRFGPCSKDIKSFSHIKSTETGFLELKSERNENYKNSFLTQKKVSEGKKGKQKTGRISDCGHILYRLLF